MKRAVLGVLLVAACATHSNVVTPLVTISQRSAVATYQVGIPGGIPIDYDVEVTNPLDQAVTLQSLEIETVGLSGAYAMKRLRHAFDLTIAPHTTQTVPIRAWVQRLQETDHGDASALVNIRGVARFDSAKGPLKTAFVSRVQ